METIFMNTENIRTNEAHTIKLNLAYKIDFKNHNKNIGLVNLSIYYTWKNTKNIYNNNEFKISAPAWNDEFELSNRSYSIIYSIIV